jgi:CHAT domain-containing protein
LIHFAGHGEFRQDNPLFSSLRFVDREVTFLDLEGYTMSAALVVLSSCSSGGVRPDLGFGAGISRGFLRAGAKALLVSLWRIGDQETLGFMEAFYESLAKTGSAGEALREAALRSRSDGRHPADWAAFQVVGLA